MKRAIGSLLLAVMVLPATAHARDDRPSAVGAACAEAREPRSSTPVRSEPPPEDVRPFPEMTVEEAGDGYAIARVDVDEAFETDDPRLAGRLTGEVRLMTALDSQQADGVESTVFGGAVRVDNEGGAWVGTMRAAYTRDLGSPRQVLALTGEGAYAGCAVTLFVTGFEGGSGVVYPVTALEP